jgi:hypothetical protein
MTVPLDERAAPALLSAFLAPAAELLASALPPAPRGTTALMAHWCVLLRAIYARRHPGGTFLCLEAMPPPALAAVPLQAALRAYGGAQPLPLRKGCLGAAVHGLAFHDAATDGTLLRETVRALDDGGGYAGAFLLRGSFDALFDATREACEREKEPGALAALQEAEAQFRLPETLLNMAARVGLKNVDLGVEERGLAFADARTFLTEPAVECVVLRNLSLGNSDTRARILERVVEALDTYHSGIGLFMRVLTGVIRGTREG